MQSNVIYIAHRGNMTGSCSEENTPKHILRALQAGFEVEVDVWYFNGDWFLGHSGTDYPISEGFLWTPKIWWHCKNIPALFQLLKRPEVNCFWHEGLDKCTLTSHGYIWSMPACPMATLKSIYVGVSKVPEICAGVCSDIVGELKC